MNAVDLQVKCNGHRRLVAGLRPALFAAARQTARQRLDPTQCNRRVLTKAVAQRPSLPAAIERSGIAARWSALFRPHPHTKFTPFHFLIWFGDTAVAEELLKAVPFFPVHLIVEIIVTHVAKLR